jgi:molybdate transport system permease protein
MFGEGTLVARVRLSPRYQARLLAAISYGMTLSLALGACWLFLSNADQLWPREMATSEAMDAWRNGVGRTEFAGGLWKDAAFWRSVNLSIVTSTITAFIAALVGVPAAYALSRYPIPGRGVIDVFFSSVIVLPASSVGLCLIVTFQYGPVYRLQEALGIRVAHTLFPGLVVAQLVLALAMGLSAWRAAFDGVNPRFEHVARSLGASSWRAFWSVALPAAKPRLLAGFILAWARAMAEFGAVLLFCGTFRELPLSRFSELTQTIGMHKADFLSVAMWVDIEYGNVEYGFGIAFALVTISAVSVYAIHRIGGKGYLW